MLILLTRLLAPGIYGNLTAVAALAISLGFLPSLGAGYVLLARAAHDTDAIADVWRYAWPLTLVLGMLLLCLYIGATGLISDRELVPLNVILWIGASELLLTPVTALLSFSLQARERVPLSQFVNWLPLGFRLLALFPCFVFASEARLEAYATLQFIASLLGLAIGLLVTRKYVDINWLPRRATIREIKTGASYAAMQLIATNPTELDKAMAVRAIGAYDAGIYSATSRVMGAVVTPVVAMLLASQPRLFRHAHEPTRSGNKLIVLIALLALAWGSISGLAMAILSPLLPLIFGSAYSDTASLLPWVAIVAPFLSLRLAAGTVLVALGHPLERIGFELGGVVILATGMILLPPLLGLHGFVLSVILAEATMSIAGWYLVGRRNTRNVLLNPPP